MARNLVLIGFMGAGKTTVGRLAAADLGCPFADSDDEVERAACRSIPDIFRDDGEERFRALETQALGVLARLNGRVVSVGGGAPCRAENAPILRSMGFLVHLTARPETILSRVAPVATRPMLADAPDPLARIRALLEERSEAYAMADVAVETDDETPSEIARWVVGLYRRWLVTE